MRARGGEHLQAHGTLAPRRTSRASHRRHRGDRPARAPAPAGRGPPGDGGRAARRSNASCSGRSAPLRWPWTCSIRRRCARPSRGTSRRQPRDAHAVLRSSGCCCRGPGARTTASGARASAILVQAAAAGGVRRFVQESFAPVYEDGGERWIDERWPVRPAPYNRTVLDAEASAERFGRSGGAAVVLRFAGFYGPDRMLREMLATVRKGWAPLPGAGRRVLVLGLARGRSHGGGGGAGSSGRGLQRRRRRAGDPGGSSARSVRGRSAAPAPKPLPRWLSALGGKTAELLSRSQRMSNAKLKSASGWAPRWRSVREGVPEAARQLGVVAGARSAVTSPASTGTRRPRSTPPAS